MKSSSAVGDSNASLKSFDSQSGRGSSADRRHSVVSVVAATENSQRPRKGSGHGATMVTGHAGPQEASPRDETSSTSSRWAMSTQALVMLLSLIHPDKRIRGDGYETGDERAISLPLTWLKIFWKSYE